jgi:hypothetical protein
VNTDPNFVSGTLTVAPLLAQAEPARGPVLKALEALFDRFLNGKLNAGNASQMVRRLVHSQLAASVVALTPTPADDVILAFLKEVIPKPA